MIDQMSLLRSRLTAARLAFLDAAISSRATSIKSIQSGAITLATVGTTSATATITAVVLAKTMLFWLGTSGDGGAGSDGDNIDVRLTLTNTTTVTASRIGGTNTVIANWMLIEWN